MFGSIKKYFRENTQYGKTRYLNFLYQYDLKQYAEFSSMNDSNPECKATKIRLLIHAIEKGMSLPNCRPGFGKDKIQEIIQLNDEYQAIDRKKDKQIDFLVRQTMAAYIKFQKAHGFNSDFIPKEYIASDENIAGILCLEAGTKTKFDEIAQHRHSTRSFSNEEVSIEQIEKVIKLAQTAPSACNRQATRVFACINKEKINTIMQMHGGTRGFDKPAVVFVITGNLELYQNEYERNAVFVDGGIFVMNLLYAIDSFGLASCPVIWGAEPYNDKILSDLLNIPKCQKIISLVLAGHYPADKYIAAASAKRNVNEILRII